MTVHPVRTNGLVLGVPQTTVYFEKIQERITGFITAHSRIPQETLERMMMNTQEMATDMGTVISGREAVESGLIDRDGFSPRCHRGALSSDRNIRAALHLCRAQRENCKPATAGSSFQKGT